MRKATNGPWVFETERGGPLSVDAMQYIVREAGKLAGLGDELHPHMLRHGAGYALINDGVDVRLVQEFLGHASNRRRKGLPADNRHRGKATIEAL
jgi:type 1 fimbriae regulatory protein FimB